MSAETAAILDRAADAIERNGLHKGTFGYRTTSNDADWMCCAYGAINIASGANHPRLTSDDGEKAYTALTKHLGLSDGPGNCVADWNDAEERTAEQVIAALRGAAQAEREAAS